MAHQMANQSHIQKYLEQPRPHLWTDSWWNKSMICALLSVTNVQMCPLQWPVAAPQVCHTPPKMVPSCRLFILKGTWHDLFHQESVHRCGLGCSKYSGLDFWKCDWLAICWAIKGWFLRCQKVAQIFMWWVLDILAYKLTWMCQYMWIYGVFFGGAPVCEL